jgi:Tol biopolymer transport system component
MKSTTQLCTARGRKFVISFFCLSIFMACDKTNSVAPHQPHSITDSLLIYGQEGGTGKWNILSKDYNSGETKAVAFDAKYPSATNLRLVYIKSDSILGYGNIDGVAKFLITLPQAKYPQLSIDTRLICLVDKPADKYQILIYDTLQNRTVLYETPYEPTYPSFSSDGTKIIFAQKLSDNISSIFLVPIAGSESGTQAHRLTKGDSSFFDDYPTVTNETVYFVRSHNIDGTPSSEIFSSDLGGSVVSQLTNYTNNWTTKGFLIKDLRKVALGVDSSSLVCVSNFGDSATNNVFLYKIGSSATDGLTRITTSTDMEASPSFIPNYVKNH